MKLENYLLGHLSSVMHSLPMAGQLELGDL